MCQLHGTLLIRLQHMKGPSKPPDSANSVPAAAAVDHKGKSRYEHVLGKQDFDMSPLVQMRPDDYENMPYRQR